MATPHGTAGKPDAGFAPTHWSVVLAARGDPAGRQAALETLCRTYWPPVYGYLRRRGNSPEDAEDLTQGFFLHLTTSDFLSRPEPGRGRFRGFLIGALKHYLGSHFERVNARKRGGGAEFIDWAETDAEAEYGGMRDEQQDPAQIYEVSWALTLLRRALGRLDAEQVGDERRRRFELLRPFLSQLPGRGDYERLATALGTNRSSIAVWIHRLSQRYGELVRLEVASTVVDPAEVNDELRNILETLRRPGRRG